MLARLILCYNIIGDKMKTNERRIEILKTIKNSNKALSASFLSKVYKVSRQAIVQDVAILKAMQEPIMATPKGYIYQKAMLGYTFIVACNHKEEDIEEELQCIVDHGGTIIDVIIEHPVYGEISGKLNIKTRYDIQKYLEKWTKHKAMSLSHLNEGVHCHTIQANDEQTMNIIKAALLEKSFTQER